MKNALILIALMLNFGLIGAQPVSRKESAAIDSILARHSRLHKPGTYLFRNVNLIAMKDSGTAAGMDVLVEGGEIRKIGKSLNGAGATVVDGTGKYLMPGLTDMHVHLFQHHPMKNTWLLLLLLNGVTTVRDMCGEEGKLLLRKRIRNNEVLGPNLYQAGPIIDGVKDKAGLFAHAATPEQGRALVRAQKNAGYDFIKVYDGLSAETFSAIVEEAKLQSGGGKDLTVAGHVPKTMTAESAAAEVVPNAHMHSYARLASIEHLTGYFEWEGAKVVVTATDSVLQSTARTGVWNCPTLYNHRLNGSREEASAVITDPESAPLLPKGLKKDWGKRLETKSKAVAELTDRNGAANFGTLQGLACKLHQAGGCFIAGTDAGNLPFMVPGYSLHRELKQFAAFGMSNYQVLKTATVNAAQGLMLGTRFGTVEEGKRADLLLLDANPLEDVGHLTKRSGVMVRGVLLADTDLEQLRAEVAAAFAE